MKKFILISFVYFFLISAYILVGEYFLYRIRENVPISTVVKRQMESKEECYYGRSLFDDETSRYKYEALQYKKPSIVILGQSIVINYRDFFFHPYEKDFYNTGLMVRNLADVVYFADLIEKGVVKKPEFMVVGIHYGFIARYNALDNKKWLTELEEDPVLNGKEHLRSIQTLILEKKYRTVPDTDYGFGMKGMGGNGYRKDGSYSYIWETQEFLRDSSHHEGPMLKDFNERKNRYKNSLEFDENKEKSLIAVLNKFRAMGIEILIYVPPISDTFYNGLMKDESFKVFWTAYMNLQNKLEADHFDVIKFTTPSRMGLTDYSMNNSDHPGDVLVGKQFYEYCISPERKNKFIDKIDTTYLKTALDAPKTNALSFMRDRWN